MVSKNELNTALNNTILSASGWRGVFVENGDEENTSAHISKAHKMISAAAAYVFSEYLKSRYSSCNFPDKPLVLLGTDTRPTGKEAADAIIPVLLSAGCNVRYAGFTAAPEIMAWARKFGNAAENDLSDSRSSKSQKCTGFIYISASHNPVGHNGLKFGLTDGGVLTAEESAILIASFRSFLDRDDCVTFIESLVLAADHKQLAEVYNNIAFNKSEAVKTYFNFCCDVVYGGENAISLAMKNTIADKSLGIVCDFNGSARTVSIDRDFFLSLGLKFESINDKPGLIAHRIVPEGESLDPCCKLLEEAHMRDPSFLLGYVPDCDGDRGNLVIWDDVQGKGRALEAQEVFALACVAELSHLAWTGIITPDKTSGKCGVKNAKVAVAVNDPTSMRIDRIAEAFGVSVFRAEVGEANVVTLARMLRENGYIVRILGEGSAGGNITHPSAVRDPINTVFAIVKMLLIRSTPEKPGFFEIWCKFSGQMEKYRENFTLSDIILSLPLFATTAAYHKDAVMRINTNDHALLKKHYQEIFLREWEEKKDELKKCYGIYSWEAIAYNGTTEKRNLKFFEEAGRGGLKILFYDAKGEKKAYIWMRGSATEPVFRIMGDVEAAGWQRVKSTSTHAPIEGRHDNCSNEYDNKQAERDLLEWHKQMIMKADK